VTGDGAFSVTNFKMFSYPGFGNKIYRKVAKITAESLKMLYNSARNVFRSSV
jgi:hypothetical protein